MMQEKANRRIGLLYGVECFAGGVLQHVADLATHLSAEFTIHLLVSEAYRDDLQLGLEQELQRCGVRVGYLPMAHRIAPWNDVANIIRIIRYIRRNEIDLVHAHSSKAGVLFRIASLFCAVKTVYTPHCYYFSACRGVKRIFFREVERLLAHITDRVVLAGNERLLANETGVVPPGKIEPIDNRLDPRRYRRYPREQICRELGIPFSKKIIGGIGRLAPQKDWKIFLYAARKLAGQFPEVCFLLAGDGEQRKDLEALIELWGLEKRILLLGQVADISRIYSCLDAFVSTSGWEGLPYTYLEARFFNVPLFVSHTAFIEAVIAGPDVSMFPCGDAEALAELLAQFLRGEPSLSLCKEGEADAEFPDFLERHRRMYWQLAER